MIDNVSHEFNLVTEKELREKCIERIDVLEKVKALFLIPEINMMTLNQVAEYYEVESNAIRVCYQRNKSEIDNDGIVLKGASELIAHLVLLDKTQSKSIFQLNDGITVEIPNRGIKCFSKRAILRVGMLLRDSNVAKELRTQLLNTFEHSTEQQKTEDIDIEINFVNEIGKAYMSGDIDVFAVATQKYIAFQNRHIESIEKDKKVLAGDILDWTDQASFNRAVRILSTRLHLPFGKTFNRVYNELRYKHGIGLSQRGGYPLIQHIREDEWGKVIQSFSAICEMNGLSPSKILEDAKLEA